MADENQEQAQGATGSDSAHARIDSIVEKLKAHGINVEPAEAPTEVAAEVTE